MTEIRTELLDELLSNYETPDDLLGNPKHGKYLRVAVAIAHRITGRGDR